MLEVLMQLTFEAKHVEIMPVDGLYGLFSAIQRHIGAGREVLNKWQKEHALSED